MGSFYLVNLILAIVAMSYDDCQKQDLEDEEAEEEDMLVRDFPFCRFPFCRFPLRRFLFRRLPLSMGRVRVRFRGWC